uniref:32,7 kDa protein ORF 301 n=1 Tax=biofilter metagenome TaxID=1070537 RepID=A0A193SBQ2_9ZZZZ
MITLITGAPGTGKTAALVLLLHELAKDRALFVNGIPELKVPHQALEKPEEWMTEVPDGAAVVIDEVQNVWRPRGPGTKVPEHVAKLETHRHRGLDFFIITQGPNLVDSNVRALVGRHIHLRDLGVLGRWWYEWPECADNCRTGWRAAPIKKRYRLPKKIFDSYKSASLHIKPIRSFPKVLIVFIVALIGAGYFIFKGYNDIFAKKKTPVVASAPGTPGTSTAAVPPSYAQVQKKLADERVDFIPRLSDRPHTAPAYDELRVVVRVPYVSGAMCINDKCKCYADGSYVPEISSDACRDWAEKKPFNPYVLTSAPGASTPSTGKQTGTPQGAGGMGVQTPHVNASSPGAGVAASPSS